MKIAIFQNFLDTIGGAEVVGLTMARELKADIYTTNVDREKIRQMGQLANLYGGVQNQAIPYMNAGVGAQQTQQQFCKQLN